MTEKKRHGMPNYESFEPDDIRTIPDFYDNLYPMAENCIDSVPKRRAKAVKKSEFLQNSEKNEEKDVEF